jgi:hypothetical protein
MKQTTSRTVQYALKYFKETYGFILQRGYEVVSVEDIPAGWQVVLRKSDLVVRILRARGEDDVSFRTSTQPPGEFFDIGSVVYAATGEKIPLSSYDDLSKELQTYLDKIEAYWQGEPVKIRDSLQVAQREYRETLTPVQVVSPKEPKIIPVLHYPLMGIVLLLLFGALTTLYAVLLDRLFSTFALGTDPSTLLTGVVSPLLAICTMLLFRRRRKTG